MTDKHARDRISSLEMRIRTLEQQLSFYEESSLGAFGVSPWGTSNPIKLSAIDIIQRFQELYTLLAVERKTTFPETKLQKLEKKQ